MKKSLFRTDREITEIYERHKAMLFRVCFTYIKNAADTEDAVQETFFRLIKAAPAFESPEHEKAWLIRTASNICKNTLKSRRRRDESLSDFENYQSDERIEINGVFEVVAGLPDKYKTVIYLYYYEGYNSAEISKILKKPQSTILNHLSEARKILKERLGDDFNEK